MYINLFPVGTILPFDGSSWVDNETLPGWYACTAANVAHGVPDLEGHFLYQSSGAGKGVKAGSNSKTLTVDNMPSHRHEMVINNLGSAQSASSAVPAFEGWNGGAVADSPVVSAGASMYSKVGEKRLNAIVNAYTNHAYGLKGPLSKPIELSGGGVAFDSRPACYGLIYVRKCYNV